MEIHLSAGNGVPIYRQILRQVKHLVASGRLFPGEELPAIRVLAEQLTINPNTVARAYRELEREGVVEKRRTAGTFVSLRPSPIAREEQLQRLRELLDGLLVEAHQMNVSQEELLGMLRNRYKKLYTKTGGSPS